MTNTTTNTTTRANQIRALVRAALRAADHAGIRTAGERGAPAGLCTLAHQLIAARMGGLIEQQLELEPQVAAALRAVR